MAPFTPVKRWLQPRRSAHFRAQKSTYSGRSSSASISRARLSGRAVVEERDDLLGRGDEADHVEVDAAAELGVVAQLRRGDAQQLQLGEDVPVDEVVLGRIDPDQPRHRLAEDEPAGGDEVLERDQDGRLAPLLLDDASLVVDARDGGVGRAVAGQARHVAGRAVGEPGPDDELLLARGIVQHARRGRHVQPDQRGRVRGIGPEPLGHPVAEDAVADARRSPSACRPRGGPGRSPSGGSGSPRARTGWCAACRSRGPGSRSRAPDRSRAG